MSQSPFSLETSPTRKHEVFPNLFLGGITLAWKVQLGSFPEIDRVVSFKDARITNVPVLELFGVGQEWEGYHQTLNENRVVEYLDEAFAQDENVLIHCSNGQSRSVALVINYIMKKFTLDFQSAKKKLEERYDAVALSPSFELGLSKEKDQ